MNYQDDVDFVGTICAAHETGSPVALRSVLDHEIVAVCDGGGFRAAHRPLSGPWTVAAYLMEIATRSGAIAAQQLVHGRPGVVYRKCGKAIAVMTVAVSGQGVTAAWIVEDPRQLCRWNTLASEDAGA